jgi:hypothetical protein
MRLACAAAIVLVLAGVAGADDPPGSLIKQDGLMAILKEIPPDRAARGSVESQKGLAATEEWLVARLKALGYTPRLEDLTWNLKHQAEAEASAGPTGHPPAETTPELASRTWHNIIVDLPGKELPNEVLILSAHFDAVAGSPGADDDGTGVAALLETARVLKDRPMRRTVRLIFFNLEELGLLGSKDYVKDLRPRLKPATEGAPATEKVIGMVSLEMLGYFTDAPDSQRSPIPKIEGVFDPPTVGDFIGLLTISRHAEFCERFAGEMRKAAPELKVGVADFPPIAPLDFLRSDHGPFLLAGLPGVMLTDTSNFRNPNYHKPGDTTDTLDPGRFTLVARGVAGAAYAIAEPAGGSDGTHK